MGQKHSKISDKHQLFIEDQKIFFVGTAATDGRVNVSPKGMDSLRVINKNRILWLNATGSMNETSAHIQENSRMTLMFCGFKGEPLIIRVYGNAKVIHQNNIKWEKLFSLFNPIPGARQIFDLTVDLVVTSCGMAVPTYDYINEREQLINWAVKKGENGIKKYWKEKNEISLDGKSTKIVIKDS